VCDLSDDTVYFDFKHKRWYGMMLDNILWNKVQRNSAYKTVLLMVFLAAVTVSCGKKGLLYIPATTAQAEEKPTTTDNNVQVTNSQKKSR